MIRLVLDRMNSWLSSNFSVIIYTINFQDRAMLFQTYVSMIRYHQKHHVTSEYTKG